MLDSIFRISQLTLPVATILGCSWVLVNGNNAGAFYLFIGGFIFTLILRIVEQSIFADNIYHGRYNRHHY